MSRLAKKGQKSGPESELPGAEEFTPRAINRAVLMETVQHPATILPAAIAALGLLYMALMGLRPGALGVSFFSALVAVGAWVFNYFIRGEELAARHVAGLRERRARQRHDEAASLEAEWAQTGLEEGVKQARELREAYSKLNDFLKSRFAQSAGMALSVQRLMVLAEDTYREGVAILRRALESYRALSLLDGEKLQRELDEWQAELAQLGAEGEESTAAQVRRAGLETRIAAHERRLRLGKDQAASVEQLLAESEVLESALESTYLEAVDLGTPDTFFARGRSAEALERAVSAARRVEDRLRGMSGDREDDAIYLQAGERQS